MDQGNDRISKLPDDIIHHILSFLDMKYAVQTSTLSQRWKLIWTTMPHLNLSSRKFKTLPKFSRFVKHVLSHRDHLTDVSAVELFFRGAVNQYFVGSITSYACSHNVNRMTITYFPKKFPEFPLRLFNHHTLKHLTLRVGDAYFRGSCNFPKSAWNFPALETLHLSYITFCENTDKSLDLFSKCVNLKNLTLHEFIMLGLEVFNICAPHLSNLTIIEGHRHPKVFNVVAPQLQNLTASVYSKYVVSAPRLSSITCNGCGPLRLSSTDGFCYLEKVNLNLSMFSKNSEKDVPILLDLLHKLGSAKFLTLHMDVVEALSSCLDRLSHEPCPFDNLKCLRIDALKSEKNHTTTMSTQVRNYLLENSPHAIVIMDLPEEKPNKSRKRLRKAAEEKTMLDAKKRAHDEYIAKLDAIKQAQYEHIAKLDAKKRAQDEHIAKLDAKERAKDEHIAKLHLQVKGLMLQIIKTTIEELRVQIEGGAPDHKKILSIACHFRSMMDILGKGDRIDMEAQFFSQYEALKPMLDNRIESSHWANIDKSLFDNIHIAELPAPPPSLSSAKDMPTSLSVASTSGSKSVVQPSHNSLS